MTHHARTGLITRVGACLALVAATLVPTVAQAADPTSTTVSTWAELVAQVGAAGPQEIALGADITAPASTQLALQPSADLTIDLAGHALTIVTPSANQSAVGVRPGTTLTVEDSAGGGTLTAQGSSGAAGIGGSHSEGAGTVRILGGTVTATGGESAAGIGTGADSADGLQGILEISANPFPGTGTTGGHGTDDVPVWTPGFTPTITQTAGPHPHSYRALDGPRTVTIEFGATVSFDPAGASPIEPLFVPLGTPVGEPTLPELAGHVFGGWWAGDSVWDFADPVTADLELTARWLTPFSASPAPVVDDTTPVVGQTLVASTPGWVPSPTGVAYRWYRFASSSATSGGTLVGTSSTYTVTPPDLGAYLRVEATGSHAERLDTTSLSAAWRVGPGSLTSVTAPTYGSAKPVVGAKLTATPGTWSTSPTAYSYTWYRYSGSAASSARTVVGTAKTYTLRPADLGGYVRVAVTAKRAGYTDATRLSTGAKVGKGTLRALKAPKISKTKPKVGQKLKVTKGTWRPKAGGTKVTYQWYRAGKKIKGATKSTYKVRKADQGRRLKVKVTVRATGYATLVRITKATAKVKPRP